MAPPASQSIYVQQVVRFLRRLYARHQKTAAPKRFSNAGRCLRIASTVLVASILTLTQAESSEPRRRSPRPIILPLKQPASLKGESAVVAVDNLEVNVRGDDNSRSLQDSFEQAAIRQLATSQQTYKIWAQQRADLMGTLTLKLIVDKKGSVTRVDAVASRMSDRAFVDTLTVDAGTWKFPEGAESVELTIPLVFVPKGMDPNSVVQWERSVFPAEQKTIATQEPAKPAAQRKTDKSTNPHTGQLATIRNGSSTQPAAETARPGSIAAIANRPIALREQPLFSAKKISSAETGAQVTILERKRRLVPPEDEGLRPYRFCQKRISHARELARSSPSALRRRHRPNSSGPFIHQFLFPY